MINGMTEWEHVEEGFAARAFRVCRVTSYSMSQEFCRNRKLFALTVMAVQVASSMLALYRIHALGHALSCPI